MELREICAGRSHLHLFGSCIQNCLLRIIRAVRQAGHLDGERHRILRIVHVGVDVDGGDLLRRGIETDRHTDDGLFISVDQGQKWYGQTVAGDLDFSVVNGYENGTVTLVGPKGAYLSPDEGKTWTTVSLPKYVSGVYDLTLTPGPTLWLATRQGAVRSTDGGKSWQYMLGGLPRNDVLSVDYDASGQRLLATALDSRAVFESRDGGKTWQSTTDAGASIRAAMNYKGHLLATSFFNGLLLN